MTAITVPEDEALAQQIVPDGTRITMILPDDFHHHFRDGVKTKTVVTHASKRYGRCIAMPNLSPPVTTTEMALAYKERIMDSHPEGTARKIEPLMTLYLTDNTTPEEMEKAFTSGVTAAKYYPAGATTNSAFGVTDVKNIMPPLRKMAELGMVLCIHSEVTKGDIFDREAVFIEEIMKPLVKELPHLKIVMEHISTKDAVDFILSLPEDSNVRATVTCHHIMYNRNALLVGGIKPHFYCLPILKRESHRIALLKAVTSGNPKFFLGTDSAPHLKYMKETGCGCAGVYTAHCSLELYAESFEAMGALDKLEKFASIYGADFYGLPRNTTKITLEKKKWKVPDSYAFGDTADDILQPLRAGEYVNWQIVED